LDEKKGIYKSERTKLLNLTSFYPYDPFQVKRDWQIESHRLWPISL